MQTRQVLESNEKRFRRILTNAPGVSWTSDIDGCTVYISPKVESVLGYTKEEFCRERQLRMGRIHPADFDRVFKAYQSLFRKQSSFEVECRFRRKDGTWVWVQDRATTIHEENGVLYADGFLCDITRRKEEEAELKFQKAFLEAQANSTLDGILVVDREGRTLLRNQRSAEIFKLPEELLEMHEDERLLRHVAALMKNAESFLSRVEHLYMHPNETSRDELELKNGAFLDRYSSSVVDKSGVYYGRIWTFRDITERKRNEDELRQLSMAVVSVVITDPRGNIQYVNRKFSECSGYSREEVAGKNSRILKSELTSTDLYRNLWSTIKDGKIWSGELCNQKKNGDIYWEAVSITPITSAKGEITHYLAIKEDITARRKAERDLRLTQFSVDHASEAIQWLDAKGRIVYANHALCAVTQRSREELIGLSISEHKPGYFRRTLGDAVETTEEWRLHDVRKPVASQGRRKRPRGDQRQLLDVRRAGILFYFRARYLGASHTGVAAAASTKTGGDWAPGRRDRARDQYTYAVRHRQPDVHAGFLEIDAGIAGELSHDDQKFRECDS